MVMRSASLNENNFGFVNAAALRVRVSLPEGFVLDPAQTRLGASISSSSGSRHAELALEALSTKRATRGGAMWSAELAVTTYEMDLTEASARALRELQGLIASGKVKDVQLEVKVRLKQAPAGATSAKVWVDLMLSPLEGYFPLIDGGTVSVDPAAT